MTSNSVQDNLLIIQNSPLGFIKNISRKLILKAGVFLRCSAASVEVHLHNDVSASLKQNSISCQRLLKDAGSQWTAHFFNRSHLFSDLGL